MIMKALDLDRLVAEKVMGWDVHFKLQPGERPQHEGVEHFRDPKNNIIWLPDQWSPSTSEQAAFEVVLKMRQDGFSFKLWQPSQDLRGNLPGPDAHVSFVCSKGPCPKHGNPHYNYHGAIEIEGESLPLAICQAALVALKVIPPPEGL